MIRVFIDTNVFFAACYSEDGASFEIFRQSLQGKVQLVVSAYVLEETARNLAKKSPEDLERFQELRDSISFEVVNPTRQAVLAATRYTELKDAPIVAAAKKAHVDYLVSLDRKHLVGVLLVAQQSGLAIVLPHELLARLRENGVR